MLSRVFTVALALLLCFAASAPSLAWKFVSIADSRGSNNGVNTTELAKIVNMINAENADLVIFQGDAVNGGCDDACLSSQMDTWLGIMNTLNCPWYYSTGNHEIGGPTSQDVLRTKVDQPLNGPAGDEEMVYSFDHKDAHFVSLNSNHYNLAHHVQRTWMSDDLAATDKPHIFVYAHEPAYPAGPHIGSSLDVYPSERDDFWSRMTTAGVRTYFCGHEHLYARSKNGDIYQVINGTCGAPIHTGYPYTTAKYHYVVVDVDGYMVWCNAKDDTGVIFDTWSYAVTPTCDAAKLVPNNYTVTLKNKIVTCVRGTGMIYVEEDDRTAAFKASGSGVTGIAVGSRIDVKGTLQVLSTGERQLGSATATLLSTGNPLPKPVCMTTRDMFGGPRGYNPGVVEGTGLNNSAMLIRVAGKITSVSAGQYFYIDDGMGLLDGTSLNSIPNVGVKVSWSGSVTLGQFVTVTGVCSSFNNSGYRRLLYATSVTN